MTAFGYPQWLVGHDWMEIATVRTLRDVTKSDRSVIAWLDKLPPEAFANAGVANPQMGLSYWLWALGLRDHSGQNAMNIHRKVPHHTGVPTAPAEVMERNVNGTTHHIRAQGPYGVRGEVAVPAGEYQENLAHVKEHDGAFKSGILQVMASDSLEMKGKLMEEGKLTPLNLLVVEAAPWKEIEVEIEARKELPWAKALRAQLLKPASKTWWDLPEGARVPLIHLGANEIPWLAEFGPGQRVTQGLQTTDPVATLAEAKEAVGLVPELRAAGEALWVTFGELALGDPAQAAQYRAQMQEVAAILETRSTEILDHLLEATPADAVDTRAGIAELSGL